MDSWCDHRFDVSSAEDMRKIRDDKSLEGKRVRVSIDVLREKEIIQLFGVFALRPLVTWVVVTRFPKFIVGVLWRDNASMDVCVASVGLSTPETRWDNRAGADDWWPMNNVWFGIQASTRADYDERISQLIEAGNDGRIKLEAYKRVALLDPLLEPIDAVCAFPAQPIDWIIVGGHPGDEQPTNIDHIRFVVKQAKAVGVPVWVERLGSNPRGRVECLLGDDDESSTVMIEKLSVTHPTGSDPSEWPDDLRVRETPS